MDFGIAFIQATAAQYPRADGIGVQLFFLAVRADALPQPVALFFKGKVGQ
ncbi:TPA: hypothetical protein ACH1UH_001736 [Escherichia coli]|nr:hypothetical protein [Escherichia coli]